MEPHCQSVLTPPPSRCRAVSQLSPGCVGASEPVCFRGRTAVCSRACARTVVCVCFWMSQKRQSDSVIRCLCFLRLCLLDKSGSCNTKHPGLSTDCSPTYSSHLMWINRLNCAPSPLGLCLVAQQLNPACEQEGVWGIIVHHRMCALGLLKRTFVVLLIIFVLFIFSTGEFIRILAAISHFILINARGTKPESEKHRWRCFECRVGAHVKIH